MWHKFNLVCNHMGFSLCRFESACSTKTPWRGRGRLSVQVNGDEHISETHLSGRHMNPLSDSEACTFHLVQLREQPSIMLVGMWLEVWWSAIFTRTIIHLPLTAVADKQLQREKHNPVSSKKGMTKSFSVDSFYFVSHYLLKRLAIWKTKVFPKKQPAFIPMASRGQLQKKSNWIEVYEITTILLTWFITLVNTCLMSLWFQLLVCHLHQYTWCSLCKWWACLE